MKKNHLSRNRFSEYVLLTSVMAFRSRAKLFERRTSFLDRFRSKPGGNNIMKVKTRNGDIKEINGNGMVIVGGHRDVDNSRNHKQASSQGLKISTSPC